MLHYEGLELQYVNLWEYTIQPITSTKTRGSMYIILQSVHGLLSLIFLNIAYFY